MFGIDFGTTNSATVEILTSGRPQHYGDGEGQPYPSIVAIDNMTGNIVSRGRQAWQNREALSQKCQVITSPKTYLGTEKSWKIGGRSWTPVDVTAEIIKGLKEEIRKKQGRDALNEALVSIPVGFSPAKRKALRSAAHKAGVEVTGFVSEPTAAIFKNLDSVGHHRKIAVFDWGGGTLDISVVELQEGTVNEIASVGLALGGDELDRIIAEWAHEKICESKGVSIPFHKMPLASRDQLVVKVEEAKRELVNTDRARIAVTNYGEIGNALIYIDVGSLLSRLEQQICKVIDALKEAVIVKAHTSFDELGCILMVGGSSKLIGLYDRIQEQVGKCKVIPPHSDSDWHVAHGAALLAKNAGQYILSTNVGLQLSDNTFLPLLKEGDQIDNVKGQLRLGLVEDSQSAILNFYESRSDSPDALNLGDGRKIGSLIVDTYGFVNESILFEYGVDKDMLLWTTAISSHRGISAKESWHYDKLLFRYNLPGG